jgi:hypothetical protein
VRVDYEAVRSGIEIMSVDASKKLPIEIKQTIRPRDAADVLFLRTRIEADENSSRQMSEAVHFSSLLSCES